MLPPKVSSSLGIIEEENSSETLVCQFVHMVNSYGCMWYKGNPLAFSLPIVLLQIIAIFMITSVVWFIIKPLKQGLISAQIISGIIIGHAFLGNINGFNKTLLPLGGTTILKTMADLGFMFHLFALGVQINISMVKKVDKKSIVIGTSCFLLPMLASQVSIVLATHSINVDENTTDTLKSVASVNVLSSFPVITSLLVDLKILNTGLGRLASSASLICDVWSYSSNVIVQMVNLNESFDIVSTIFVSLTGALFLLIIIFGFRPIIASIARRVPEEGHIKEIQFIAIMVLVLICGLIGQALGNPPGLGTFLLGLVTPDGPPLGTSFVNKMDALFIGLFVPIKYVFCGLELDMSHVGGISGAVVGFVLFISYLGKFVGGLLSAIYFGMVPIEAVALGLIMCCKGVVQVVFYFAMKDRGAITGEEYSLLLGSMLVVTGIARPLICFLYDPSARYLNTKRNAIMHNHPNEDLKMLVCIHHEDNVAPLINLLDVSNPTRNNRIKVVVLNLMELSGRAAPVLESTHPTRKLTSSRSWPKRVANAFHQFQNRNHGNIVFRYLTSISPYATMHNDVCTIALEQDVNIVIVPFHEQCNADGGLGANATYIRMVNQKIMLKAPCSVGTLIGRGPGQDGKFILKCKLSMFRVYMIFLGGEDDNEALAYCIRLADNPQIFLTFVRIRPLEDSMSMEESKETKMVDEFKSRVMGNKRVSYKEELVNDAIETTRVIKSIEGRCDLCIVGKHHDPNSKLVLGLTDWSEYPELGIIGDMLASSHMGFSILVVQQSPPKADNFLQPVSSSASRSKR